MNGNWHRLAGALALGGVLGLNGSVTRAQSPVSASPGRIPETPSLSMPGPVSGSTATNPSATPAPRSSRGWGRQASQAPVYASPSSPSADPQDAGPASRAVYQAPISRQPQSGPRLSPSAGVQPASAPADLVGNVASPAVYQPSPMPAGSMTGMAPRTPAPFPGAAMPAAAPGSLAMPPTPNPSIAAEPPATPPQGSYWGPQGPPRRRTLWERFTSLVDHRDDDDNSPRSQTMFHDPSTGSAFLPKGCKPWLKQSSK